MSDTPQFKCSLCGAPGTDPFAMQDHLADAHDIEHDMFQYIDEARSDVPVTLFKHQ